MAPRPGLIAPNQGRSVAAFAPIRDPAGNIVGLLRAEWPIAD
ncbi:hypothetical protein [Paractinoplanes atraurantiacus]|nr:hypothetical protein [Actinoplanes atraurantiacus]